MCACVHVCMCACVHVCIHLFVCVSISVCACFMNDMPILCWWDIGGVYSLCARVCVCMHVFVRVCVCVCVFVRVLNICHVLCFLSMSEVYSPGMADDCEVVVFS